MPGMLKTDVVTTREILRNYRGVFAKVKKTKQPTVVFSKKEPQVAIISLSDLEGLQKLQQKRSTKALLNLTGLIPKGSGLPRDLSTRHDDYCWG